MQNLMKITQNNPAAKEAEEALMETLKENLLPHAQKFLKPGYNELAKYMGDDEKTFMLKRLGGQIYFINIETSNFKTEDFQELFKNPDTINVHQVEDFMEAILAGNLDKLFSKNEE